MAEWLDTNLSQWVGDNNSQWGILSSTLNHLWTDNNYVYASTAIGLDIYDLTSEEKYAYITYSGGFSTVWANDDKVFLGTSISGIKYIDKTCISGSIINPCDLTVCLDDISNLTSYSQLTSGNVVYIHGFEGTLGIITVSGVDVVKLNPQSYRSYTTVSGIKKCFMTSNELYYLDITNLYRLDNLTTNWAEADKEYTVGSGIFEPGIELNDIFITEDTATNNYNTICVATTSGIYLIDENTDEYNLYYIE